MTNFASALKNRYLEIELGHLVISGSSPGVKVEKLTQPISPPHRSAIRCIITAFLATRSATAALALGDIEPVKPQPESTEPG